ncbi:hypothetical protein CYY_004777 [Polysphondylium violaceum]|uniref:UbiA prenyltransferase family protein n=1 Tax=Polysphondylium violaceum TaxID=133409 RepID=A0A8J4PSU9_9MYCE|nr:hypothetical protein CYY_004777 [Polysphondylium violaceum]
MIQKNKLVGIFYGLRFKSGIMPFTTLSVGILFGYKEIGVLSTSFVNIYFLVQLIYTFSVILNSLCDSESNVDIAETSKDRVMFDYGLNRDDIFTYIYGASVLIVLLFCKIFFHFSFWKQMLALYIVFHLLFVSVFYNMPPIRFKKRLFMPELSIVLSYGLLSFTGYFFSTSVVSLHAFIYGVPCFLLVVMSISSNLLMDVEDDKRGGSLSTPMVFGKKGSFYIYNTCFIL